MPFQPFNFGDSEWDLLRKILDTENASFDRLQQILTATGSGGGGGGGNVNLTGINGVAPAVNNGVVGADVIRVTVASNSTGAVGLNAGANIIGSLTANQSVNEAQIAGTATLTGNGVTGAGSQRVTIASDNTAFSVNATLAASAAIIGNVRIDQTTPGTTNGVSIAQLGANTISTGNGVSGTGVVRVAQVSDGTGVLAAVTNVATIGTSVTPGTAAANLGKAEDAAHVTGDTGVAAWGVANEAQTTLAADGDYIGQASDTKGNKFVVGNIAHDGVDAGNPVKVGQKSVAFGTNPTAVTAGDRTDWIANRAGIPFMLGGHPNIITLEAAYTTAQTDTAVITVGATTKIVVTQISVVSSNTTSVNVAFRCGFGTANTPTTTGVVLTHPNIAAGSGFNRGSGSGILGIGADNEDLRVTSGVPTGGSIRVLVSYFTIDS